MPFFYDRLVTEEPLPIRVQSEIDSILASGQWGQWRSKWLNDREALVASARAWCVSSHWDSHTPRLEDWKQVSKDIASARLSSAVLAEMATTSKRRICFPPIPFFELEQLDEIIKGLSDPVAVAVIAEQVSQFNSLLAVPQREIARTCWGMMTPLQQNMWQYSAWCWMVAVPDAHPLPWPSDGGFAKLSKAQYSRREETLRRLESAAVEAMRNGDRDSDAIRTARNFAQARGPAAVAELEALLRKPEPVAAPPQITTPQAEPELEDTTDDSQLGRHERLCMGLFQYPPDLNEWRAVESEANNSANGRSQPHPLIVMADFLRGRQFPEPLDREAWSRFAKVLKECNGLLDVNPADRSRSLPVLELVASIRSTVSLGEVAVDLITVAGTRRADPAWWRALKAELRPQMRREGWIRANDRISFATAAVEWRARWLTPVERLAFESGFAPEHKS
jgi:hypothetical protein